MFFFLFIFFCCLCTVVRLETISRCYFRCSSGISLRILCVLFAFVSTIGYTCVFLFVSSCRFYLFICFIWFRSRFLCDDTYFIVLFASYISNFKHHRALLNSLCACGCLSVATAAQSRTLDHYTTSRLRK